MGQAQFAEDGIDVLLKEIGLVSASKNLEIIEKEKEPVLEIGPQLHWYLEVGISGPALSTTIPKPERSQLMEGNRSAITGVESARAIARWLNEDRVESGYWVGSWKGAEAPTQEDVLEATSWMRLQNRYASRFPRNWKLDHWASGNGILVEVSVLT